MSGEPNQDWTSAASTEAFRAKSYDVVVVVVSWNVREFLEKCLISLHRASEGLSIRVVVVDNASQDGTPDLVRSMFPNVELITNERNVGFARANNIALRIYLAGAKYLLLLNPDTIVAPDAVRRMVEFMESDGGAGIVGCKVVKPDGSLDWPCKRSYITPDVLCYKAMGLDRLFPQNRRFGRYHLSFLDENQIHEVDSVVGAFLMIRGACLREIGLLDESLFMFGEDMEWCYRSKERGWKVYYVPTVKIIHYKGQSTGKQSYRMIYHWYHSTWKVYQKRIGPRYPTIVNCAVWAGFHSMCVLSMTANLLRRRKRVPSRA